MILIDMIALIESSQLPPYLFERVPFIGPDKPLRPLRRLVNEMDRVPDGVAVVDRGEGADHPVPLL
jgi:hypothetical protein